MRDLSEITALPRLSDGRLLLRPHRADDAAAVAAMCDDPTAARWVPLPAPYSLADGEAWVADAERRWYEDRWATFVVCDPTSDRLLGSNGLRVNPQRESGEIGYLTHRDARRRGVASGGVRLLVAWAFDVLGLARLQIRADARNVASRRTIQSCGFHYEGLLRSDELTRNERVDDVICSLLADDPRPAAGERRPGDLGWPRLEDGRLVVRPFEPDDAAAVQRACDDPAIARWIHGLPSPYSLADAAVFIAEAQHRLLLGERARLAITDAASGELLGSIGLDLFRNRDAAEIGYWVKTEARRQGVALAAARLIMRWAFEEIGVERLEILTYPGNEASQALAGRLGFSREALLRGFLAHEPSKGRDGRVVPSDDGSPPARDDQVQLALLREDWVAPAG